MIYKKLFELQQKIGAISKDSKHPHFKSNYFDINKLIEELKPTLTELKLVVLQPLVEKDGKTLIRTMIIDTEDDSIIDSTAILPDNIDPQKMGSAITYYRRYALQSMLFLQAEDDDAHSVVNPPVVNQKPYAQAMPQSGRPELECCGIPMKHLKGNSKTTGKPYDFHACDSCKKQVYPSK